MLIDVSYFTNGHRHIFNASTAPMPSPESRAVNSCIEHYISYFQEQFLSEMLGLEVGNAVNGYLTELDNDDAIEHNDEYDVLIQKIQESFADYVFYNIIGLSSNQATITGIVRIKCDNEYIAPIEQQVRIWNNMVKRNRVFNDWANSSLCGFNVRISKNMLSPINSLNL